MFHFCTAYGALLVYFALIWHDQPAKPIVGERRPAEKEPARCQTVATKNHLNIFRRTFAALRRCPEPALLLRLKSK
jgi:hypothetical protein